MIESVTIEKASVCSGEENLIRVKAHTTNGTDEYLHYVIDGQLGPSVPVRIWQTDHGTGEHVVSVFGRGNVATTVPLPEFEVRECVPPRFVNVEKHLRANTWADYDLVAKIAAPRVWHQDRTAPAKPFEPALYKWSFGDGQTATTSSPSAQHNYEGRSQDSLYSYFLVSVEIRSRDNQVLRGRTSLAMMNPAFEALKLKGIVSLMISLNPRFPELGSDGKVTQEVHLWHTRPGPVRIEQASRTKHFLRGSGETPPEPVDVVALLGTGTIPPGSGGITATVVLDPAAEADVLSVNYVVSGTSEEGYPVSGSFSVMRPPRNPTRENSIAVNDPALRAKILAARSILHREFVSDEDIFQLEHAGKFANLNLPESDGPTTHTPVPGPTGVLVGPKPRASTPGNRTADVGAPTPPATAPVAPPRADNGNADPTGGTKGQ